MTRCAARTRSRSPGASRSGSASGRIKMSATVIVGGGLAGGYAAALLARAGARPIVLERDHRAVRQGLRRVPVGRGAGLPARRRAGAGRLGGAGDRPGAGRRTASGSPQARLPFTALGLTRRRLDEALLHHAEAQGADVRRGVSVKRLDGEGLETSDGALAADRIILASGKHDVRGAGRELERRRLGHGGLQELLPRSSRPQRARADRRSRDRDVRRRLRGAAAGGGRPRQPLPAGPRGALRHGRPHLAGRSTRG